VNWIVIRNWERFQHRDAARQNVPTWIKLYTQLWSDDAFLSLSEHRRLMLIGLWVEYASTRRRLPLDTRSLSRRLFQRVTTADLEALNDAGFIDVYAIEPASEPAGLSAGLEKRREEVTTKAVDIGHSNGPIFQIPNNLLRDIQ
jgi:hypothetical protein